MDRVGYFASSRLPLVGEIANHPGYEKHASNGRNSGKSRNGSFPKSVIGDQGETTIEVPRCHKAEFEPQLVPKGQRRLPGFYDKVIALRARVMTTREIQGDDLVGFRPTRLVIFRGAEGQRLLHIHSN
jgi:transposase-like protein